MKSVIISSVVAFSLLFVVVVLVNTRKAGGKIRKEITIAVESDERLSALAKETVSQYTLQMLLFTEEELDKTLFKIEKKGNGGNHESGSHNLFCFLRAKIDSAENYEYIRHSVEIYIEDQDFRNAAGLNDDIHSAITFSNFDENNSSYILFELNLHENSKLKILEKELITVKFRKVMFK